MGGLGVLGAELEVDREGDCVVVTDGDCVVTTTLASEAGGLSSSSTYGGTPTSKMWFWTSQGPPPQSPHCSLASIRVLSWSSKAGLRSENFKFCWNRRSAATTISFLNSSWIRLVRLAISNARELKVAGEAGRGDVDCPSDEWVNQATVGSFFSVVLSRGTCEKRF